MTPFDRAEEYRQLGWSGTIPLPPGAKWPPPNGYTGQAGAWPSGADLVDWREHGYLAGDGTDARRLAAGNLAIRVPPNVIGIDVDAYDGKVGKETLDQLEASWGKLPPTWISTSRLDGVSGIRLYRIPADREWPGNAGRDVDIVRHGHRYAVVWPSVHPDGREYAWIDPDGVISTGLPGAGSLPELPPAWVDGLTSAKAAPVAERSFFERQLGSDVDQIGTPIPDGSRHAKLVEYAGYLRRRGVGLDLAQTLMLARLRDCAQPPDARYPVTVDEALGKLQDVYTRYAGGTPDLAPIDDSTDPFSANYDAAAAQDTPAAAYRADAMFSKVFDRDRLDTIEPPTPLIEGVLDVATLAMIAGKFGTYKSFVSLAWACSIATETPWFGHEVVTGGSVLYIAAEGASGLRKRVRAWEVAHLGGDRVPADRLHVYNGTVNLADKWQVETLGSIIDGIVTTGVPLALLVVDTLHKCAPGLDEQSSKDMSIPMHAAATLRERFGATVLLNHHTGHNGERSRGSSALEDDIDTSWVIRLDGDPEDRSPANQRVLVHRKTKDSEPLGDLPLVLRQVEDSAVVELGERTAEGSVTTPSKLAEAKVHVRDTLRQRGPLGAEDLCNSIQLRAVDVRRAVQSLTMLGELHLDGREAGSRAKLRHLPEQCMRDWPCHPIA